MTDVLTAHSPMAVTVLYCDRRRLVYAARSAYRCARCGGLVSDAVFVEVGVEGADQEVLVQPDHCIELDAHGTITGMHVCHGVP